MIMNLGLADVLHDGGIKSKENSVGDILHPLIKLWYVNNSRRHHDDVWHLSGALISPGSVWGLKIQNFVTRTVSYQNCYPAAHLFWKGRSYGMIVAQ